VTPVTRRGHGRGGGGTDGAEEGMDGAEEGMDGAGESAGDKGSFRSDRRVSAKTGTRPLS
jgi:hypothetical protein